MDHHLSFECEDSTENIILPVKEADWHNSYGYFAPFNIYLDNSNLIYVIMQDVSLSGGAKDVKVEVCKYKASKNK